MAISLPFFSSSDDPSDKSAANKKLGAAQDITAQVSESDFIPYACHIDPHTLLTKNGELMQILTITGNNRELDYEAADLTGVYLRDTLRRTVSTHIKDDIYAFWVHVVRMKKPIELAGESPSLFGKRVQQAWDAEYHWQWAYYNQVYISILRQGQSADLFDMRDFKKGALASKNQDFRESFINRAHEELDETVRRIEADIGQHFSTHRLGFAERAPSPDDPTAPSALFSEPLEFLVRLTSLSEQPMPVMEADISQQLHASELSFGYNALESRKRRGKKRFASIVTLKHYQEASPERLDQFLQLPQEMIVSQSFTYTARKDAITKQLEIRGMTGGAEDPYVAEASGLNYMLNAGAKQKTDYGMQHSSIMIMVDEYTKLDAATASVQEAIGKLGLVGIREDIKLEECFWSQLPGNFEFIRRPHPIPSAQMGGLTRLDYFPSGTQGRSAWKEPIAILPTLARTPYFFHFHYGEHGHTLLLDYNSFPDTVGNITLNFLLTQATRLHPRIIVFDRKRQTDLLAEHLDGVSHRLSFSGEGLRLNPLALEDSRRNRSFLLAWLMSSLPPELQSEDAKEQIKQAIEAVIQQPIEQRAMGQLIRIVGASNPALAQALANALPDTVYGHPGYDRLDFAAPVTVFDMDEVTRYPAACVSLFAYLMHRVVLSLDGRPTIIVLHEAWQLLDNNFFAPRLESLLHMLSEHNAMLMAGTRDFERYRDSAITADLIRLTPTKLFIPDDIPVDYAADITGLNKLELRWLKRMERQHGEFLVKHAHESVPSQIHIQDHDDLRAILAGDHLALAAPVAPS